MKINTTTLQYLSNADIALDDALDNLQSAVDSTKTDPELLEAVRELNTRCENLAADLLSVIMIDVEN